VCLHARRARRGGNEALVDAVLDADVASLTPSRTPRVLNDPERGARGDVVADDEHAVVHLHCLAVSQHTAAVRLPRGGVDADGDGAVRRKPRGHGWLVARDVENPAFIYSIEVGMLLVSVLSNLPSFMYMSL